MKSIAVAVILVLTILSSLACKEEPKSPARAASPSGATVAAAKHAPSQATPGSHEDWCDEHQVAESLCTRCSPALVAAFRATGDWCEEHGLPESQCLLCNPDLKITRPAKGGGQ